MFSSFVNVVLIVACYLVFGLYKKVVSVRATETKEKQHFEDPNWNGKKLRLVHVVSISHLKYFCVAT